MSLKKEKCYLGFKTYHERLYVQAQLLNIRKEFGTIEFKRFNDKINARHEELKKTDPQYKKDDEIYFKALCRNFQYIDNPQTKEEKAINAMAREARRIHFATRPFVMKDKEKAKKQLEIRKEYEKALNSNEKNKDDTNILILENEKGVWTI